MQVTLSGPGLAPQRTSVRTGFAMAADLERLRWYLEDFLEYPVDPAPTMAKSIEARRAIAFDPLPLQDWTVPIVYESAPLTLFPSGRVSQC